MAVQDFMSSSQTFLNDLTQTFAYLEKCTSPKVYINTLKLLLRCKYFEAESHPVQRVELLCLLGQEKRRLGDREEYKNRMEETERLFLQNVDDFEGSPLSHVFYLHSQARFQSEKKIRNDTKPKELYDEALQICERKICDHPETAANLLFAGRNAKLRKDNKEAKEKYQRALFLFKDLLGNHFMTALCLKDLADFFFCLGVLRRGNGSYKKPRNTRPKGEHLNPEKLWVLSPLERQL